MCFNYKGITVLRNYVLYMNVYLSRKIYEFVMFQEVLTPSTVLHMMCLLDVDDALVLSTEL